MKYFKSINRLFLVTTVLPTLVASLYYCFLASDIYISESRFVVRSQDRQKSTPLLGFILEGVGFSSSQEDSYTVLDYILSRDAIRTLDEELHLKDDFSDDSIDFIKRFPGILDWDESFENFFLYYKKMTSAQFDSVSNITTLTTRAFKAEMAWQMNNRLVELAEELVNRLNERGRRDLINFSYKEVIEAQKKAKAAALALASFRNEKGVIDPEKQSTIPLQQVAKLQDELISIKAQIMQLEKLAIDNPQLPVLRRHLDLLENEITSETLRIAGAGDKSLASKAAEYQRLTLEKEFADRMLASAMSTLEQARNEAQRKQLYLERVTQPSKPDEAMEPRRLRTIAAVLVLGMITWGIMSMLIAGIKEHSD